MAPKSTRKNMVPRKFKMTFLGSATANARTLASMVTRPGQLSRTSAVRGTLWPFFSRYVCAKVASVVAPPLEKVWHRIRESGGKL